MHSQIGHETIPFFLVFLSNDIFTDWEWNYSFFLCLFFIKHILNRLRAKFFFLSSGDKFINREQNSPFFFFLFSKDTFAKKEKISCTFKFCLFSLAFRTHNYKQTKTSCAFKFCRHVEAVERGPDELEAL